VIDFRYHLVSIVAVFLALAIGIVLGSTELQGTTIDGLRSLNNSLKNQLSHAQAAEHSAATAASASDTFLGAAESKLVSGYLPGDRLVVVTEPGASSSVVGGISKAAVAAGATVTGTVALQPKFNDLSGATQSTLSAVNQQLAQTDTVTLNPATTDQTGNQQQAAQLIAAAVLDKTAGATGGLTSGQAQQVLQSYAHDGFLTVSGTVTDRATLAVLVTPDNASTLGSADPVNEVLLAVTGELAAGSAAAIVAGSAAGSAASGSAIQVLRGSSASSAVSTVDNADTTLGQIASVWALSDQLGGGKPGSYGISGASAVSPVPSSVPSTTPTASSTPSAKATASPKATTSTKATRKVKQTVGKK
jgi:hypothetical protein